jgi:hypothetical protein
MCCVVHRLFVLKVDPSNDNAKECRHKRNDKHQVRAKERERERESERATEKEKKNEARCTVQAKVCFLSLRVQYKTVSSECVFF